MKGTNETVTQLVQKLDLKKHPEGGYYKETYQAAEVCKTPEREGGVRASSTAIYYLLQNPDFSAWHRLKSDELWHHYQGSSLTIYLITQDGKLEQLHLGNPVDNPEAQFQLLVKKNQWFCATVDKKEAFTLVGCTVSPGFDYKDFELADPTKLTQQYPQHAKWIEKFTRTTVKKSPRASGIWKKSSRKEMSDQSSDQPPPKKRNHGVRHL